MNVNNAHLPQSFQLLSTSSARSFTSGPPLGTSVPQNPIAGSRKNPSIILYLKGIYTSFPNVTVNCVRNLLYFGIFADICSFSVNVLFICVGIVYAYL